LAIGTGIRMEYADVCLEAFRQRKIIRTPIAGLFVRGSMTFHVTSDFLNDMFLGRWLMIVDGRIDQWWVVLEGVIWF
jgi:hypothetical protein